MGDHYRPSYNRGQPTPSGAFTYGTGPQTTRFPPVHNSRGPPRRTRSGKNSNYRRPPPRRTGAYRRDFPFAVSNPMPYERALLQPRPEPVIGLQRYPLPSNGETSKDDTQKAVNAGKVESQKGGASDDKSRDGHAADSIHLKKNRTEPSLNAEATGPKWSNPVLGDAPALPVVRKNENIIEIIRAGKVKVLGDAPPQYNDIVANKDYVSLDSSETQPTTVTGSLNDLPSTALPANQVRLPAQQHHKRKHFEVESDVKKSWFPQSATQDVTPWAATYGHLDMTHWLHNEILDFYDYVKPLTHEMDLRDNLCDRVEACLRRRFGPSFKIFVFGSFPAGLFLPEADMDLAFVSFGFEQSGVKALRMENQKQVRNTLSQVIQQLTTSGLGSGFASIWRARVPIVKFTDTYTNLRVDLSLENLNGMAVQKTFRKWKEEHPYMPMLVAMVKQFLVMRELNDVHLGGIGGYSTVCLVVSFLQLHPPGTKNLGEVFLELLDFYGNRFELDRYSISLNPPRYVEKTATESANAGGNRGNRTRPYKLTIQDPHDPDNNISAGSSQAAFIFSRFKEAHTALTRRMAWLNANRDSEHSNSSVLAPVLAGNYNKYAVVRDHLRRLAE